MGLQEKWIVFVFIIEPFLFHVCQCLITYGSSSTTPAWTPPTWSWDPDCGEHWVKDSTSGRCYQFSNTSLTWNQAQAQCQNLGAGSQLVSINSPEEQYFVQKFLWGFTTPGLWIGVNTLNTGIGYHWSDGSPFSFLNWSPGEPNNVLNIEHCGEMVTDGYTWGKWNDNNCASQRGYICEKPSLGLTTVPTAPVPPTPGGYFYGCPGTQWLPYRRNCYLFNTPGTGWSNATQYCALQGSKLASIADENEQNFVLSQVPGTTDDSQYWIGFNDILTEMNFMWSDGSPVCYTNWAENEPNNYRQSEDCVGMYLKDGTWIDENCKLSLSGFICKAPKKLLKIGTPQHNPGTGCSVRNSLALGYNCYIVKESPKTWSAAQIYCKAYGGNLAVIQDRYQQAFLASQIAGGSGDYWIGLSNGGNTTVTGEALQFTAWSSNYTKSNDTARQASTCIAMKTERSGVGLWVGGNCALANRFICQYLRTGFSTRSTTPAPTTMSSVCPSSWHLYSGYCYKAYNQESDYRTWWEARDFCKAQGTDLISLHSRAEENFAFAYPVTTNYQYQYHHGSYSYDTNKVYWIGASDFDVEKGFKWSDGSTWAYTNWKAGEPNDASGNDDCVERYQSSQNWNDNNCYTARPFICKIQLGQQLKTLPPTVASTASASCAGTPGWLPFNGSCYYISQQATTYTAMRKTWFDARLFCMKHGGDLPSIHSEQENGFITTLVSRKDLNSWFGLTLLGAGSYGWSDGTLLDYEKWMPREPSKGNEKCGMMFAFNGYWNDVDCNRLYYFVCKRPMGTVQAHTPSPTPLIAGGCPQGFTAVHKNNKCYKVFGSLPADRKNYTFAKEHCKLIGDDLASMSSHIELATVITLLQGVFLDNSAVWIGMTDLTHSRRFTWDDSSPLYITNWAKGQPGYGWQDHCVEMYTGERQVGKWANAHCGNFKGYVCEATRKTIYPTSTPIPQGSCQTGYQQYSVGDCYKLHTTPKSWVQAKTSCETEGTSLISVLSVFEQAFVDILTADIATPVWLGLADQNHTGTFTWVDNWEVYYTNWGRNVPTHKTGEGCVSTQNGHWNDTVCANSYPYICKKSKLTPPPPTVSSGYCLDSTWKHFGGSCYYIALTMYKSWSESERDCKSRGMELASILSRTELLFILREIDYSPTTFTKDVWIGLLRHIDGHFIWSDGSSLNYLPWDDGQPSNTTSSEYNSGIHTYSSTQEDCGEIKYTSGKLNDEKCSATNGYVCKTPQTPATSAPLSGATQPPAIIG